MTEINKLEPWQVLEKTPVVDNKFLKLYNITFKLPNNQVLKNYFIAEKDNLAIIIVVRNGKIYLIKEWERGVGVVGYKFPGGYMEPGETQATAATRELKEELGFQALELKYLGESYVNPGFMTTIAHYFLCIDFTKGEVQEDPFELFEGQWVDISQVDQMIKLNEIKNSFVLVGYLLAKNYLDQHTS